MMGMHGEACVNSAIQEADLLLAFGMRFDDRVTGNLKTYAPHAKKIHVEIDPSEIGKNVHGGRGARRRPARHARGAAGRIVPEKRHDAWLADDRRRARRDALRATSSTRRRQRPAATPPHVIHDLWQTTDGDALVVTDVGQHQMWEAQYYQHEQPRTLITSGGLGTMGFALPAAIGAKFARPDDEVWVVAGDGGFQMTQCELATLQQEELEIKIAIINNGYLGMVRQWQEFFYDKRYAATPMLSPDFVKLAEAYGIAGHARDARDEVSAGGADGARRREGRC